jgi:hypothetical protein
MNRKAHVAPRAYLLPYSRLKQSLQLDEGSESIVLTAEQIRNAVKLLLRGVEVDEAWYLNEYQDVRDAIAQGNFRSGKHHFIENGYFEGRRPCCIMVDDDWYGRAYPDVSEGLEFGEVSSYQEHFEQYGEKEGRFPVEE